MLDAEEYLHLAIHATQHQQHHAALEYLHKSLELSPENAKAIFLLAAEHAELGLFGRAIKGMLQALELDPQLDFARYQLGILYMQTSDIEAGKLVWDYLGEQASDSTIKLVSKGLSIIDDDYERGFSLIEEAAKSEIANQFLRSSIENIRDNLAQSQSLPTKQDVNTSDASHSLFLSAYKNSTFNKDDD